MGTCVSPFSSIGLESCGFLINSMVQLSGADYAMANFIKVSGRRPDEEPLPKVPGGKKSD
jgi:hypothetical protein